MNEHEEQVNEHEEQLNEYDGQAFRLEAGAISFAGGERVSFPYPVAEALAYGERIVVVRLDIPTGEIFNENVYGLTPQGRTLWQVPRRTHVYEDSPYTTLARDGERLLLVNWDGTEITLDPATGRLLRERQTR